MTTTLLLLAGPAMAGCGGSSPTRPPGPDPPVVAAVTPAEARAGVEVTITGSGFGTGAAAVTFRGQPATVLAVAETSIRATVPAIAPGDAPVVVTVSGRSSSAAAFRVLASAPVITSIEPAPPRAGGEMTIRGEALAGAVAPGALVPHQAATSVLVDDQPVEIAEVAPDRIVVILPLDLPHGPHQLQVRAGELASEPFPFDSGIFDARGLWLFPVEIDANDCPTGPPVDARFVVPGSIRFDPDAEDRLDLDLNGLPLNGEPTGLFTLYDGQTLRQGEFTFSMAYSNFDRDPGEDFSEVPADFELEIADETCVIHARGENAMRVAFTPVPIVVSLFDFSALGGGGQAPAQAVVPLLEPLSFAPVGTVPVEFDGFWFNFPATAEQPHHVGSFTGTIRVLQGQATLDLLVCPLCEPAGGGLFPWFTSQGSDMVVFDLGGAELDRLPVAPVDNQMAVSRFGDFLKIAENTYPVPADRVDFQYNHFANVPAGDGFSRLAGGALWQAAGAVDFLSSERFTSGLDRYFEDGFGSLGLRTPVD